MRAALAGLSGLLLLSVLPAGLEPAAELPSERRVEAVLAALGADRPDVRACIMSAVASSTRASVEIERLEAVLAWIERRVAEPRRRLARLGLTDAASHPELAMAKERSDRFVDILETFSHERRLDGRALQQTTEGALGPEHILAYARVRRALAQGHDPKKVFCGT